MANLFDYLRWRGDLRLTQSPFNAVDNLILCCLSYIDLKGIVSPSGNARPLTLREAADRYFECPVGQPHAPKTDDRLLQAAAESERFGSMLLSRYINEIDPREQAQFSAVTVTLEDTGCFVAYRGTDNTLVGLKEDFNMSFLATIPSQRHALAYLNQVAAQTGGPIWAGGHSKGGNLAMYAAIHCAPEIQERLQTVYSNDGPGFDARVVASESYRAVLPKLQTLLPQSSIVGMLLEHEEPYTVVHSNQKGLWQHSPYSWEVERTDFIRLEQVTNASRFLDRSIRTWLSEVSPEQREQFIETLFHIFTATHAQTVSELSGSWLKNAGIVLRTFKNIDEESRCFLLDTLGAFLGAAVRNISMLAPSLPGTRKKQAE